MPSEIPQLEVITAIGEVDTEDFVAQLLFSQGWNIIQRVIDFDGLMSTLHERNPLLRTVIIYSSDLDQFSRAELAEYEQRFPAFSMVCVDGIPVNSHALMTHIRSCLRAPLITLPQNPIASESVQESKFKKHKLITITGTSGSPGRSHLTLLLASYFSWRQPVEVIDADLRSPSLAYMSGSQAHFAERFKVITLDVESKPNQLPNAGTKEFSLVDIGALPSLREVVTDRRWQATLINNILEQTSTLIYITKSSGLGLLRLENFISEFPILLRKIPIIYILNQRGASREDRSIEARFTSLTMGERAFVLPQDPRPIQPRPLQSGGPRSKAIDLFSSSSRLAKEVDKIAQSIA